MLDHGQCSDSRGQGREPRSEPEKARRQLVSVLGRCVDENDQDIGGEGTFSLSMKGLWDKRPWLGASGSRRLYGRNTPGTIRTTKVQCDDEQNTLTKATGSK